ncbi:MAG: ComEA family DNA-binding protein [Patescibacteria group bacterium]|nr:ComEA family DNA-binding protein [Patescibacteria group bacterium]
MMLDARQVLEKYAPFLRLNWIPLGLGLLGLIFFIYGLIALLGTASKSNDLVFESSNSASASAKITADIAVDVEGAVINPGMYSLRERSRVRDALVSAGGLSAFADRGWVEKNLNLAAKLSDGVKIYIPRAGEAQNAATNLTQTGVPQGGIVGSAALINVNTATSAELDTLPGIGPVTAEKIINNRPYSSVDELLSKKAVTDKVFSQIKDKVTAN